MEKKASFKQIQFLQYLLDQENKSLDHFTDKTFQELTHVDIMSLYSKLYVPITVDLRCFEYIINKETDDYILGTQYNKETKQPIMDIISFKNLLVLDYDVPKITNNDPDELKIAKSKLLKQIIDILKTTNYKFHIYETYRGYHVYCVSKLFNNNDHKVHKLMNELGCDRFYIGFTRYVGFVVRINKKTNRDEQYIERFVGIINEDIPSMDCLIDLIKIKDELMNQNL
jgi:hypothetical protein